MGTRLREKNGKTLKPEFAYDVHCKWFNIFIRTAIFRAPKLALFILWTLLRHAFCHCCSNTKSNSLEFSSNHQRRCGHNRTRFFGAALLHGLTRIAVSVSSARLWRPELACIVKWINSAQLCCTDFAYICISADGKPAICFKQWSSAAAVSTPIVRHNPLKHGHVLAPSNNRPLQKRTEVCKYVHYRLHDTNALACKSVRASAMAHL